MEKRGRPSRLRGGRLFAHPTARRALGLDDVVPLGGAEVLGLVAVEGEEQDVHRLGDEGVGPGAAGQLFGGAVAAAVEVVVAEGPEQVVEAAAAVEAIVALP